MEMEVCLFRIDLLDSSLPVDVQYRISANVLLESTT